MLEEDIIQPYSELSESSKFPETLEVTERRQFRERSLIHISDKAYLFFLHLEQRRVELLNVQILKRARDEMVEKVMTELKGDGKWEASWLMCFENKDIQKHKVK